MGSHLTLTCSSCRAISTFPTSRIREGFVCRSCGRPFDGISIDAFPGCVYVLSNPSLPGLLKIGMTEQDAFLRASELSAETGVPEPFVVEAYATCQEPASGEAAVHRILSDKRKQNREFFQVSLEEAVSTIEQVLQKEMDYRKDHKGTSCPFNTPTANQYPFTTPSAPKYSRGRASSPAGNPVRFRAVCPQCGREHWYAHRGRPLKCVGCGGAFDRNGTR